jgi:hypothetical protein
MNIATFLALLVPGLPSAAANRSTHTSVVKAYLLEDAPFLLMLSSTQNVNLAASCKSRGAAACTTWPNRGLEMSPLTAAGPKN